MADCTICPLLLLSSDNIPIIEINKKFLTVVERYIDQCKKSNIDLHLSNSIWEKIMLLFPWGHNGDDILKQYISHWTAMIIGPIYKICKFHNYEQGINQHQVKPSPCSIREDQNLDFDWQQWLNYWGTGNTIMNKYVKGLATSHECCNLTNEDQLTCCQKFTILMHDRDWNFLLFPWYYKYPLNLPSEGDFIFDPPDGWKTEPIHRGLNNGYLDKEGNEWKWDRFHNDHWDVQLHRSTKYRRISPIGIDIDMP